jgi:hypothetical protein
MKSPYDLDLVELAGLVTAIQQKLYLERDPERVVAWNPGKDVDCRKFVEELDELMGEIGLHPAQAEPGRSSPYPTGGVESGDELSGLKRHPDLSINSGRLTGYVSANFEQADIFFPATQSRLLLLRRRDVEDLRRLCDQLLDYLKG